jgi:hypothetical protein
MIAAVKFHITKLLKKLIYRRVGMRQFNGLFPTWFCPQHQQPIPKKSSLFSHAALYQQKQIKMKQNHHQGNGR